MKLVIVLLIGFITGGVVSWIVNMNILGKASSQNYKMSEKHLSIMLLLNRFLQIKQEKKSVSSYLEKRGIHTVAIYGMSYVGERLYVELEDGNVRVAYGIDRKAGSGISGFMVYSPEEKLPPVDAIVVTPTFFFESIYRDLSDKVSCPIISLEEILYEV